MALSRDLASLKSMQKSIGQIMGPDIAILPLITYFVLENLSHRNMNELQP